MRRCGRAAGRDVSPEPPLLFLVRDSYALGPGRPGRLGGGKGRYWDTHIQSVTPSPVVTIRSHSYHLRRDPVPPLEKVPDTVAFPPLPRFITSSPWSDKDAE
jgi:hypothetical protein